ncbi:ATP-binding protein [Streptomyces sp. NBC_01795]|uniref:sensor histidine kinase n=1 Tax=unclassified Streptomyces TaxID=2593676 RepID=UPI002DD8D5D1|nr:MULTISPECIES: ATP-binding protein [unclassified Streptomyces]WSA91062.1 ATP-binding protein [Streptomyces sp. NBC_01795]WSB75387.1 ATP-binding protein [Streptomyces sp. NBC_01775]WSS16331.1 ATP-binding protein [Streptomyces sp. NBC_01186]
MPEPPSCTVQTGRGTSGTAPAAVAPSGPPGAGGARRRHGRAPARESAGDAAVRRRLVRLAVLPAGLIAVAGAAVVAYVMRVRGGIDATGTPGPGAVGAPVWGVLAGSLLLVCAVIVTAAMLASSEAHGTVERCAALRRSTARGQAELESMLHALERGERPRPRTPAPEGEPVGDALDLLSYEAVLAQRGAETAVAEAAALIRSTYSGSEEKVEVFVNLARRLQSLVHREIELLDELENEVEDPDLLKGLFHVDHLATRIRRHAENLAVLGGAVSRRQWTRPVSMTEVLRSSIAEVEQYPRVKLVPPIEGTLRGHAVADVIHLLAELIENATVFSAPQTQVLLRAQHVTAGLAIEVEDRGLGMTPAEQSHMNAVLSEPGQIDVPELLRDGRIGLFVVSALARRHGVVVQLQSNIYGGVQAVLVLPRGLLGDTGEEAGKAGDAGARSASGAPPVRAATAVPAQAGADREGSVPPPAEPEPVDGHPVPARPAASVPDPRPRSQIRAKAPHARPDPEGAAGEERASGYPGLQPLPRLDVREQPETGAASAHGDQRSWESAGEGPGNGRPRLPKRRRQEHLVPELRDPPPAYLGSRAEAVAEEGHDPGLMAAFRRGTSLAYEACGADEGDPGTPGGARSAEMPGLLEAPGLPGLPELPDLTEGSDPAVSGEVPGGPSPASGGDTSRPAR